MGLVSKRNLFLKVDLDEPLSQAHIGLLREATSSTTNDLTVFIALSDISHIDHETGWTKMQRRVAELYAVAAGQALLKEYPLNIDVVPLDFCAYSPEDMDPYSNWPTAAISSDLSAVPGWWPAEMHKHISLYDQPGNVTPAVQPNQSLSCSSRTETPWKSHPHVAVGGTFDHLHVGHKILLTAAAMVATKRVVCGISADRLLESKKYRELLEPYRDRELHVLLFLRKIRKDLIVELVPISDPYGPTAVDASIEALVVSQETLAGSQSLNVRREENGLQPMKLMAIDLVATLSEADKPQSMQALAENTALKVSSTAIRAALYEKQQRGSSTY
ncbi:hypothetical protein IWW36_000613 [Coemansia brasiliensis]|uniref:Cytidyltransferase-like domain-containing protein n=1 Tax=Coemansia brasiliensis TaxID=2650707 RepID=A0A9W8ID56_9FUNG|nr:hypothetical protein IWW36_000613 [Coemansia brasiliensis]